MQYDLLASLHSSDDLAFLHNVPLLYLPTLDDHALSTSSQTTATHNPWLHLRHPGCHCINHSDRATQSTNLVLTSSVYSEASGVTDWTDTSHTAC